MQGLNLYMMALSVLLMTPPGVNERVSFINKSNFLPAIFALKIFHCNRDPEVHLGDFNRTNLNNEKVYPWFKSGYDAYKPDKTAINAIHQASAHIKIVVFGGAWCDDTQKLLPAFYKTAESAGISPGAIILVGVDREKHSRDGRSHKYHISKVPTFIIYYDGKETGRIVENVHASIEADMWGIIGK